MSTQTFSFAQLFKTSSTKKELAWTISVIKNQDGTATIRTIHGQVGGQLQTTDLLISKGKNIGKANETTPHEQALSEAESKWNKQLDKNYSTERGGASKALSPMLAHTYEDHKSKVTFPSHIQRKYDGCVSGSALIKTKEYGYKTIKWLVDNKIACKVLSMSKNKLEYKDILYHFLNKKVDSVEWYEIETESGEILKLTGNHPVYLPDLNCYRRVDELTGNENLMMI